MLQLELIDYLCALINKVISRSVVSHFAQSAFEFISAGIANPSLPKPHHKKYYNDKF